MTGNDTLLIGYSKATGSDVAILAVGKKEPGEQTKILNWFQGKEAEDLYDKLANKKEEPNQ